MLRRLLSLIACAAWLPAAVAEPPAWGGSIALATDHLLRGTSRSSNDTALSAEVHVESASGWLAALWSSTSRVRTGESTTVELAATLGYGASLGDDWSLRGSLTHYESPWHSRADFYRYDEFTLDLRFRAALLLSVSYSPNTSRFGAAFGPVWKRNALAYEATWQHELRRGLRGFAGAGYFDLSDLFGKGYWYGSAGLSLSHRHWHLDAAYVIPQRRARELSYYGTADRRALFTLRRDF
jgi:uncharacterized protein (TIGR02001 family)